MSEDDDIVWQEATANVRKLKQTNRIQEKPQKKVRLKNETEEISLILKSLLQSKAENFSDTVHAIYIV